MRTHIIAIGNSKGLRIPKVIMEQCGIAKEVILKAVKGKIIITPAKTEPRKGWSGAFVKMRTNRDDLPLINDNIDFEGSNWEWK